MKYYEDPILGKGRAADVTGGTGGGGTEYIGGYRITIAGQTISNDRYMPIESVSGNTVTLMAGHAYKAYATSTAITLNTEAIPANSFGLEGHIELFVSGTGYVVTGTNVVLAQPLEPDSVNNCTVRFHDGLAIISVEDHVAGYIVVNGATSGDGSLYYGISTSTNDYVAFDASLNGTIIPLAGAVAEGEKHVVGNGYEQTTLTGAVDCGTSKFTVANLSLNDVQVTGGTMTLGDVFIPSGSTVEVSGGGLAVEKVTGDGGAIDLGGTYTVVSSGITAYVSGGTVSGGSIVGYGGFMALRSGAVASITDTTITGNTATGGGGGIYVTNGGVLIVSGCIVSGNSANSIATGGAIFVDGGTASVTASVVSGNAGITPNKDMNVGGSCVISASTVGIVGVGSKGVVTIQGNNTITQIKPNSSGVTGGSVIISAGATVTLTSSIEPGGTGGITVLTGGCTVNGNAIAAGTYTSIDSNGQPT